MNRKIGIDTTSLFWGVAGIGGVLGCAALYVWVETQRSLGSRRLDGQQIFLLLLAPVIACLLIRALVWCLAKIHGALTRYEVKESVVVVRSPGGARQVAWSRVRDFLLTAEEFPKAPSKLVLLLTDGGRVSLPIQRFRAAGAEAVLREKIAGLSEWGIDRVRLGKPVPLPPLKVRWRLHKKNIIMLAAAPAYLLLAFAPLLFAWNLVNYYRIMRSHLSADATITRIDKEHDNDGDSVWTDVNYAVFDGRQFAIRRHVFRNFATQFRVGDRVTVDYLPSSPWIGRIRDWDLDSRQWAILLLALPVAYMVFKPTKLSFASVFRPLRRQLGWASLGTENRCAMTATLESLSAIVPDRHVGTMILKPPKPGRHKMDLGFWSKQLRKAGIKAREVAKKFLLLAPEETQRLLGRLGGTCRWMGDYMVLDGSVADAERMLLETSDQPSQGSGYVPEQVRFYCLANGMTGPTDEEEKRSLFQKWVGYELRRLYGGATPVEVPEVEFAELLKIDPSEGMYELLIERLAHTPRIWLWDVQRKGVRMAECVHGRWVMVDNVKRPGALTRMRPTRSFARAGAGKLANVLQQMR